MPGGLLAAIGSDVALTQLHDIARTGPSSGLRNRARERCSVRSETSAQAGTAARLDPEASDYFTRSIG
jgi:hypothetical protein